VVGFLFLQGLAKAALDQHLAGTLDQLEQEQQEQLQRQLTEDVAADPCGEFIAGLLECEGVTTEAAAAAADGEADGGSENQLQKLHEHSASNSSIDVLVKQLKSSKMFGSCKEGYSGASSSVSSVGSSPAASRSTSYGSFGSLCSSVFARSSSVASSLVACSPCSTSSIPRVSSSSSIASCSKHSSAGVACAAHARGISIDSTIAESVVASSLTDHTCAICFDANATVMMAGCCHCVCTTCARSLLERTSGSKPVLCPFCRAGLSGFVAAPST
jgi:hypothetical protein